MRLIALDPGPVRSAYVELAGDVPLDGCIIDNEQLVTEYLNGSDGWHLVIEMIACYGMPVGKETFETCLWIGRFIQAWGVPKPTLLYRKEIVTNLCGSARAKDSNVRQALIDRYGGKDKAIGRKRSPGPLYGFAGDCWSALAVGVTWLDKYSSLTPAKAEGE